MIITAMVVIVIATGFLNAARHQIILYSLPPKIDALFNTIYGQVLLVKILVVSGMLVNGGLTSVIAIPKLMKLNSASNGTSDDSDLDRWQGRLKLLTVIGSLLGFAAVILGSVVVRLHPSY